MSRGKLALAIAALIAAGIPGHADNLHATSETGSAASQSFATKCSNAGVLLPPHVTLHMAETVDPAPFWKSPSSPTSPEGEQIRAPFCRLTGAIDGDIGFEIWLPRDWNSRLLGTGVGGEAGYFNYRDMARGVEQGFVTASSDTGHKQGEPWIDDARKAENYSHIAYHRLTSVTKAIIGEFYGTPAAYSYFMGCSGGGRQGLRELQLYPDDYDGALIGAPGLDVPLLAARLLWVHLAQNLPGGAQLTADDWSLIAQSAINQCDADDGLADGVIADPRNCAFTVDQLECGITTSGDCLPPEKIRTARAIIAPLSDSAGRTYDYGLLPGITSRPGNLPPLPVQMFGGVVHNDPAWNPANFDIASDLPAAQAAFPSMDASSAEIGQFVGRGGKLVLYHGWADASVQPESSIDFFSRLEKLPEAKGTDFARLYMVPGMQHCRGGEGTDHFGASDDRQPTSDPQSDMLAALIAWVEHDTSPGSITARRLSSNGTVSRSRPLCPYPQKATYRGSGSIDHANNFYCKK